MGFCESAAMRPLTESVGRRSRPRSVTSRPLTVTAARPQTCADDVVIVVRPRFGDAPGRFMPDIDVLVAPGVRGVAEKRTAEDTAVYFTSAVVDVAWRTYSPAGTPTNTNAPLFPATVVAASLPGPSSSAPAGRRRS